MQAPPGREAMTRDQDTIVQRAHDLLQAAGATREPVSLVDVVSTLNLSLIRAAPASRSKARRRSYRWATHTRSCCGAPATNTGAGSRSAHEIGHFVLHSGRAAPERGGPVNQAGRAQEREADVFAAELLMPEHLVRQAVLEVGADTACLASRFEVSEQAISVRLRRLGLAERQSELLPPSRDAL